MCGSNDGAKEQKRYNKQQEKQQAQEKQQQTQAINSIYTTFGLDAQGNPVTEKVTPDSSYVPSGSMVELLGREDVTLNGGRFGSMPGYKRYQMDHLEERRNRLQDGEQHYYGNHGQAYENHQGWQENLDGIYSDVKDVHTKSLDEQRDNISDAMMAQLIRQGMIGSHLTDQYEYQVDDSYQDGLARIDSIASGARSSAESGFNSIMNDAIAQVNAGNLDAANTGVLRQQIGNTFQQASDDAQAQQITGFFDNILRAYEMRRQNKGDFAAEQSYYSAPGYSGTVTGGGR